MVTNIKQATVLVWVVSCLLNLVLAGATFLFLVDQDRWGPEDFTYGFTISEVPHDISTEDFVRTLENAAVSNGVNLYKDVPSVAGDVRATDYYLFEGNSSQVIGNIDAGIFPTFSSAYPAALHDASDLERRQLTGSYMVQGSSSASQNIISSLADSGITAQFVSSGPGYVLWSFFLVGNGWGVAVAILVLLLLLALCQLQSVRLSVIAARRTSGESRTRVRMLEVLACVTPVYVPFIASMVVLAAYSVVIADGYRLFSIGMISLQQSAGITALTLLSMAVVVIFSSRQSLGELIKGKRPETTLSIVSGALIMVAAVGAASTVSSAWHQAQEYGAEKQADEKRLSQPDLVQPRLGYALQTSQATKIDTSLGDIFIDLDQTKNSFLAQPDILGDFQVDSAVSVESLVVNPAYLSAFTDMDQQSIEKISRLSEKESTLVVLIPSRYESKKDEIQDGVEAWGKFSHNQENPEQAHISLEVMANIDTGIVPILYFDTDTQMYKNSPVIVVVNPKSGVLPAQVLGTLETVYRAEVYKTAVTAKDLDFAVIGYQDLHQMTQLAQGDRKASLVIALTGAVVALGALVMGTVLLVRVYKNRKRTAIFLQVTSGAGFGEIYGSFLSKIFLLSVIALSVSVIVSSLPPLKAILVALGILLLIILTALMALRDAKKSSSRLALEFS